MDENRGRSPRRLVAVLAVAGALVAVPAGVALAGGSDEGSAGSSTRSIQSTAPDRQDRDRGGGDRGDCPEKRGGGQDSVEL